MSHKSLGVFLATLLISTAALTAQVRTTKPNDFTIELGGRCWIYSLGYQRAIGSNFALDAAISYFGAGSSGESAGVFFLAGGARYYMLKKDTSPYLSAGIGWASAATSSGPFDESGSSIYFYVSPGFEYRASGGFVFRGGVYLIVIKKSFWIWPGLTFGIAY